MFLVLIKIFIISLINNLKGKIYLKSMYKSEFVWFFELNILAWLYLAKKSLIKAKMAFKKGKQVGTERNKDWHWNTIDRTW